MSFPCASALFLFSFLSSSSFTSMWFFPSFTFVKEILVSNSVSGIAPDPGKRTLRGPRGAVGGGLPSVTHVCRVRGLYQQWGYSVTRVYQKYSHGVSRVQERPCRTHLWGLSPTVILDHKHTCKTCVHVATLIFYDQVEIFWYAKLKKLHNMIFP